MEAFLDRLSMSQRTRVLEEIRTLTHTLDVEQRLILLARVARFLSDPELAEIAASARGLTSAVQHFDLEASTRVQILTMLIPHLSGKLRASALKKAWKDADTMPLESFEYKVQVLAWVAPLLPSADHLEALREALQAIRLTGPEQKPAAVSMIAPILPPELLNDAIAAAQTFLTEYYATLQIRALGALARCVPGALTDADLNRIFQAVNAMKSDENKEFVLVALGPQLAAAFPREIRQFVNRMNPIARSTVMRAIPALYPRPTDFSIRDEKRKRLLGRRIVSLLPRGIILRVLYRWRETENSRILAGLSTRFSGRMARQAIDVAMSATDERLRCRLLTQLLPYIPDALKPGVADAVLATGADVGWDAFIRDVVPAMTEAQVAHYLDAARMLASAPIRGRALLALLPRLQPPVADGVVAEILEAIMPEESPSWLVEQLGRRLSQAQIQEILASVSQRRDREAAFDLIAAVIPFLAESDRAGALRLGFHYGINLSDGPGRRDRVMKLVPQLASAVSVSELYDRWREALAVAATRSRDHFLADTAALAPMLAAIGGPDAVTEVAQAVRDIEAWWP